MQPDLRGWRHQERRENGGFLGIFALKVSSPNQLVRSVCVEKLTVDQYDPLLAEAVDHFWRTRLSQASAQKQPDQGSRSAVTGGKQLDGFIRLLVKVAKDVGVPGSAIYTKGNHLPGFFRPTKDWDFLILSPRGQLVAVVECKSQVGSFGNNFNNRVEEALGSAVDIWTAFREQGFAQSQPPWLGYMMMVEKSDASVRPVRLQASHFEVRPEFDGTSYLNRYVLFCQKLMQERHYTATALIWSNRDRAYDCPEADVSIDSFLLSFMGFLQGKLTAFDQ
jgi:hypothetical protein